jgi:nitroreductase
MDVIEAIRGRASVRAYLDKPVPRDVITQILEAARWAPSGVNTQPWHVHVVEGTLKRQIGDEIIAAREAGRKPNQDYKYYPDTFPEPYLTRRRACGMALYGALGIDKKDIERRKEQWYKNYHGFGAPVELFVFVESKLEQGSWVDMGMFLQNILLAARGFGLETCPQAAMAEYPDIVRGILGVPETFSLICGIALGYADDDDPVNGYRTEREPVESFTVWHPSATSSEST